MRVKLKISPCPNDTFAFYALLHNKIDTRGMEFEVEFLDIETLNSAILEGRGDVIKASIAITTEVVERYQLLSSGAALGRGNGPIVVRRPGEERGGGESRSKLVALPGKNTTAALLFGRYFEGYTPVYCKFNEIAQMVSSGEVELGVLIHEGRFTYGDVGLEKVLDLGEKWESESGMPLPLGGIYASRDLDSDVIGSLVRESVEWAMRNPGEPMSFVREYASELSESVMQSHIDYFVNSYTVDLGEGGREAVCSLCQSGEIF